MSDGKPAPSDASRPPNTPELDRTFYTWTTIFKVLSGLASKEEINKYNAVDDVLKRERRCKKCEDDVDWLYQYSRSCSQHR
jgi:mitochondrial inner membrane protease ATP23